VAYAGYCPNDLGECQQGRHHQDQKEVWVLVAATAGVTARPLFLTADCRCWGCCMHCAALTVVSARRVDSVCHSLDLEQMIEGAEVPETFLSHHQQAEAHFVHLADQ
jgi:hypothetical protein